MTKVLVCSDGPAQVRGGLADKVDIGAVMPTAHDYVRAVPDGLYPSTTALTGGATALCHTCSAVCAASQP